MTGGPGDRPPGGRPPGEHPARSGRRALFSDPSLSAGPAAPAPDLPVGRRALFSDPRARSGDPPAPGGTGGTGGAGRATAVVHCRTCRAATPMSPVALLAALVPSLWLPTRPWPRLMRCPACHHMAWCRIDWPRLT